MCILGGAKEVYSGSYKNNATINNNMRINSMFSLLTTVDLLLPYPEYNDLILTVLKEEATTPHLK